MKLFTKEYQKFWIAMLGAILTVVNQYFGQNMYVQMAIALATAFGVVSVPNKKS